MFVAHSITRHLLLALLLVLTCSTRTAAHPAICPKDPDIIGYSSWSMLQNDIDLVQATSTITEPVTFVLCPDTTFRLTTSADGNQGLYFRHSINLPAMTIQCGLEGSSNDNCVVRGGLHHVWIDRVGALSFQGITFEAAERGSVWMGTGQTQIAFDDCIWKDNTHSWTTSTSGECPNGCAAALGGQFGAANVTNCQFLNNQANSGAVFGESMIYNFTSCLFEGNTATAREMDGQPSGSAITLVDSASNLTLSNTCFIDNISYGPATVKIDDSSTTELVISRSNPETSSLSINKNTYFDNNRVAMGNLDSPYQYCHNDIYTYGDLEDTCVAGTATCCHATEDCEEEPASDESSSSDESGSGDRDIPVSGATSIRSLVGTIVVTATAGLMLAV